MCTYSDWPVHHSTQESSGLHNVHLFTLTSAPKYSRKQTTCIHHTHTNNPKATTTKCIWISIHRKQRHIWQSPPYKFISSHKVQPTQGFDLRTPIQHTKRVKSKIPTHNMFEHSIGNETGVLFQQCKQKPRQWTFLSKASPGKGNLTCTWATQAKARSWSPSGCHQFTVTTTKCGTFHTNHHCYPWYPMTQCCTREK